MTCYTRIEAITGKAILGVDTKLDAASFPMRIIRKRKSVNINKHDALFGYIK